MEKKEKKRVYRYVFRLYEEVEEGERFDGFLDREVEVSCPLGLLDEVVQAFLEGLRVTGYVMNQKSLEEVMRAVLENWNMGPAQEVPKSDLEHQIFMVLKNSPGPLRTKEVWERVKETYDVKESTVSKKLGKLQKQRLVVSPNYGVWQVP